MKRIINIKIPQEHYKGAPCLVWCFDDRFHDLLEKFRDFLKKDSGIEHIDTIEVAGGAKDLASPNEEHKRQTLLWEIASSIKLHQPPFIGLMVHADCGAYGKKFQSDKEELDFYQSELERAKEIVERFLKESGTNIPVKIYYADFEGLTELS